ncbi:degenerin unc-8 [Trichonephila clavipes]|nr:degenerin unc-8 [Trichonephila clavipes]
MIDLLNKDIGVRVVVHDPLQLPYVSEYGLNIRPGDSTSIQVEKYQVNRLGLPWGKCLKSGKHLPFNYSYEPYSQLGCRRYCQNFYIKQHCNCVKRSLLSPSFNRPSKRKLNLICNFSDPVQRRCADKVVELIENETIQCNCYQACRTWRHGTTTLRVKEDIEDVSRGLGNEGSFRSYYPYGLNVIWKGESVLLTFKQKSEDSLYIPNFDKSIDNSNNIGLARISRAKRRKRVTRDMTILKNSMLELAVNFDDNYNTGLIKSFMFGMNKTEIKIMTDILSRYKFRDSHGLGAPSSDSCKCNLYRDYIDDYHQHVVTGDLGIVKDDLLRNFMEKVRIRFSRPYQPVLLIINISKLLNLQKLLSGLPTELTNRHTSPTEPSVTGSAYLDALQLWLFPQSEESEPDNFIWQQDGAPPHWYFSVRDQ